MSRRISQGYTHAPFLLDLQPISLHPNLQPVTGTLFEFLESYSKFPLAIYFTFGIANFYVTLSINLPSPSSAPTMSIGLFPMSISPLLP